MRPVVLSGLCLAIATLAACASPSSSTTGTEEGELVAEGADAQTMLEVKLYDEPRTTPDPACDRYTSLELFQQDGALKARVEHKLSETSLCRLYIAPNERIFDVTESSYCGSRVFTGATGEDRIVINDHSTRFCEDVIPALVEVELTADGFTSMLYSPDE